MANHSAQPLGITLPRTFLVVCLLAAYGCGARPEPASTPSSTNLTDSAATNREPQRVRQAAVAGLFYPAEEKVLSKTVDTLLQKAPEHSIRRLKALVCPHAGYTYSGQTAAIGYKTLAGRDVRQVIIMGPSHYALFQGVCIPDADGYRTPLGVVPISEKARHLAATAPFVLEPRCVVQRPGWAENGPQPAPPTGGDTPETWEHSVEVQVPFLQKSLNDFRILPMVFGKVDSEQVAKAIAGLLDEKTIIVASSDLSHYHPYGVAKTLDAQCLKAICDLDIEAMQGQEACGKGPILALMYLAKAKAWKAELLDARNSGDVTGEKDRVVGYSAVAF